MSIWNLLGLANKKDVERVSGQLETLTKSLEVLDKQNQNMTDNAFAIEERMSMSSKQNFDKIVEAIEAVNLSNNILSKSLDDSINEFKDHIESEIASRFQNVENRINQMEQLINSLLDKHSLHSEKSVEENKISIEKLDEILKSTDSLIQQNQDIEANAFVIEGRMSAKSKQSFDDVIEAINVASSNNNQLWDIYARNVMESNSQVVSEIASQFHSIENRDNQTEQLICSAAEKYNHFSEKSIEENRICNEKLDVLLKGTDGLIQQNKSIEEHALALEEHLVISSKHNQAELLATIDFANSSNGLLVESLKNSIAESNGQVLSENICQFQNLESRVVQIEQLIRSVMEIHSQQAEKSIEENGNCNEKLDAVLKSIKLNSENLIQKSGVDFGNITTTLQKGVDALRIDVLDQLRSHREVIEAVENISMHINETLRILWVNDMVDSLGSIEVK